MGGGAHDEPHGRGRALDFERRIERDMMEEGAKDPNGVSGGKELHMTKESHVVHQPLTGFARRRMSAAARGRCGGRGGSNGFLGFPKSPLRETTQGTLYPTPT
jgi:hypothetical protein